MNAVAPGAMREDKGAPGAAEWVQTSRPEKIRYLGNEQQSARRLRGQLCAIHLLLLVPLTLFLCFYNLGTGANMGVGTGIDESWYIQTAQEMKATGRWWLPTREGEIFFYKPPLKFWITEISSSLFGESIASYRYPDALLGLGYVLLTYATASYLFLSLNAGLFAALALLSCHNFLFVNGVRNDTLDIIMTFLDSIALLLLWYFTDKNRAQLSRKEQLIKGAVIGLLVGLSVLTKSVAGYYLYGIFAAWLFLSGNIRFFLRERMTLLLATGALSAFLPALWFVPHALFTPGAWRVMFGYELMARFSMGFHHATDKMFYWKLLVRDNLIPPVVCYLALLFAVGKLFTRERSTYTLLLAWVVLPFAVFSALPSRLEWYIVPCFFPMALLVGAVVAQAFEEGVRTTLEFRAERGSAAVGMLFQAAFYLLLTGASAWSMGESIWKSAVRVYDGQPRLVIDEVVEEIRESIGTYSAEKVVFEYNHPPFATRERIFYNMVKANAVTVDSLDAIKARIKTGTLSFVFTDLESGRALLKDFPQAHYRMLGPVDFNQASTGILRKEPMLVIATGPQVLNLDRKLEKFHDASRMISLGEHSECHHSSYADAGSNGVIPSNPFNIEIACAVDGDHMLITSPTVLRLRFSKMMRSLGDDLSMDVFVDSRRIEELPRAKAAGRNHRVVVPAGAWKKGSNNLTVRFGSPTEFPNLVASRETPLLERLIIDFGVP